MSDIKFTKTELKKQKDLLKRFYRYLPTLKLKKQQLQLEIRRIRQQEREKKELLNRILEDLSGWVAVFSEAVPLTDWIRVRRVKVDTGNIAGVRIPVFRSMDFETEDYDLVEQPLWIDRGIKTVKKTVTLKEELSVLSRQIRLLKEELRITTQRVNLFEKVRIPETRRNIKRIMVYLGDQQTAAVVCGKIAKRKLQRMDRQ